MKSQLTLLQKGLIYEGYYASQSHRRNVNFLFIFVPSMPMAWFEDDGMFIVLEMLLWLP